MRSSFIRSGIIPYSSVKLENGTTETYFLIGKSHTEDGWEGSGKWTSFGGKPEGNETPKETAVREFYEETMGFFNDKDEYLKILDDKHAVIERNMFYTYMLPIEYDPKICGYFKGAYQYARQCMKLTNTGKPVMHDGPDGLYEIVEIFWVPYSQMQNVLSHQNLNNKFRIRFIRTLKLMMKKFSFNDGLVTLK